MCCSPFDIVVFSPEFIVGLVHEHSVFEEHDIKDPPDEDDKGKDEKEFPVGPGHDSDENCHQEQVKERPLRWSVPHIVYLY